MSFEIQLRDRITIFCGIRASGKSHMAKWLIKNSLHEFKKVYVICPTESIKPFFSEITTPECVHTSWDEEWVKNLSERLTRINTGKSEEEVEHCLLVLDDIFGDFNPHTSKSLRSIISRSRHYGLGICICIQQLYMAPPICRCNCNVLVAGQQSSMAQSILCDEFCVRISKKEFIELYQKNTLNHSFFCINNSSVLSEDPNELYGCLKAPSDI